MNRLKASSEEKSLGTMQGGKRQVVLGRAGSGKTRYLLEKLLPFIQDREERSVLFLVPTYSQVEHLKRVLLGFPKVEGFLDLFLYTFTSLPEFSLKETLIRDLAGPRMRDLILEKVLQENTYPFFERVKSYPGFRRTLLEFIKEVKENPQGEGELAEILGKSPSLEGNPSLKERVQDLTRIISSYQSALREKGLMDHEDLLREFLESLQKRPSLLADVRLLAVDGFYTFTPVEKEILKTLWERIPEVLITLPYGGEQSDLFSVSQSTLEELRLLGFKTHLLKENHRTEKKDLLDLEKKIFTPSPVLSHAEGSIRIIVAADREDEAEQIARHIRNLVDVEGFRYRDIGLIFRSLKPVQPLLEETLHRFGIPHHFFSTLPLSREPITKAAFNLLQVLRGRFPRRLLLQLMKSSYFPEARSAAEEAEIVLGGRNKPCLLEEWLDLAEEKFPSLLPFLKDLKAIQDGCSGDHPPSFFYEQLKTKMPRILLPLFRSGSESSFPLGSEKDRREVLALHSLISLMEEVVRFFNLFGKERILLAEFLNLLLREGEKDSFSIPDRRLNVVNIIDAMEARQWELPVTFVGGLLEKEFPLQVREDLFLNDQERERLTAGRGIFLKPMLKKAEEERYLFYVAITRAKGQLFLSYPETDGKGNPTLPSFFLKDIQKIFSGELKDHTSRRHLSQTLPEPEESLSLSEGRDWVFSRINIPVLQGEPVKKKTLLALYLYNKLLSVAGFFPLLRRALLFSSPPVFRPFLRDARLRERIRTQDPIYTPQDLKDFVQCPFLYFTKKILGLKEPALLPEEGLDPRTQGSIIHKTLQEFFQNKGKISFEDILKRAIEEETREMEPALEWFGAIDEISRNLNRLVEKDEKRVSYLNLMPARFEFSFGNEVQPPLLIQREGEKPIRIGGRLDRMDETREAPSRAIVVDYKNRKGKSAESVWKEAREGTDLQIPLYMMAAEQVGKISVAAGEVWNIKDLVRNGISLDPGLSATLPGGEFPWKGKGLDRKEMEALWREISDSVRSLVARIRSGEIEVNPHDHDRCGLDKCSFYDLCRVEKWRLEKKGKKGDGSDT